jgi:hypothetical protein
MDDGSISQAGRQARFEQWEKLGLDAVKQDLATGGYRLIGGPPQVRALAQEWVRIKEAEQAGGVSTIQADGRELLQAIERATRGTGTPVVIEELRELPMTADRARAAFHYLKSKGWIEANFSIFYAARLSAAGQDAIEVAAKATASQGQPSSPASPEKPGELLTLKPGIWGMSIDLKEAWRRLRRRLQGDKETG